MERLINGLTFEKVKEKLTERFSLVTTDQTDNYESVPAELLKMRFIEVLGLNYSFEVVSIEIKEIAGSHSVVGVGKISIYDDDGNFVCSRSQAGGCNVVIVKATGIPKDLSNDYKSAVSDIFKKCCQELGTALYIIIERKEKEGKYVTPGLGKKSHGQQKSYQQNTNQQKTQQQKVDIVDKGDTYPLPKTLTVVGIGKTSGKALRIPVKDSAGKMGEFLLWETMFNQANVDVLAKLKSAKAGMTISTVYKENVRGENLQFEALSPEKISA